MKIKCDWCNRKIKKGQKLKQYKLIELTNDINSDELIVIQFELCPKCVKQIIPYLKKKLS